MKVVGGRIGAPLGTQRGDTGGLGLRWGHWVS